MFSPQYTNFLQAVQDVIAYELTLADQKEPTTMTLEEVIHYFRTGDTPEHQGLSTTKFSTEDLKRLNDLQLRSYRSKAVPNLPPSKSLTRLNIINQSTRASKEQLLELYTQLVDQLFIERATKELAIKFLVDKDANNPAYKEAS